MAEDIHTAQAPDPVQQLIPIVERAQRIAAEMACELGPRDLLVALARIHPATVAEGAKQHGLNAAKLDWALREWSVDSNAPRPSKLQTPRANSMAQTALQHAVRTAAGGANAYRVLADYLLEFGSAVSKTPVPAFDEASASLDRTQKLLQRLQLI